jgi:dTDP-glucose pyrophosphorylase
MKLSNKNISKNRDYIADAKSNLKKILERFNLRSNKIIFIIKDKKLVGSITDGDIRRGFTKGHLISSDLSNFYNKTPLFLDLKKKDYKTKIKIAKKKNIQVLPVVTSEKKYLGFVRLDNFLGEDKVSSSGFDVVIMAGGFGKRLLPITKKIPKPLVKIGNNPIIDALIEKCKSSQINKIYVILHYKANLIKNYLVKKFPEIKFKFEFIIEKKPLDTAGGLKLIDQKTSSKNFLLINSDIITNINFDNVHKFFTENRADLVVCATKNEIMIPYGVLNINNQEVENITEKPIFDIHINSGIYFLNKKIINQIKKNEKINAVDLVKRSIKKGKKIFYYPIYENWIDIGNHTDLIKAKNLNN